MFGYIRPLKEELKVRDYEQFKACYCGMCHTLGHEYGLFSRFILNYDFTFLAMLIWDAGEEPSFERRRCIASPCKRKSCCKKSAAMVTAAGYSVILARGKLFDSIMDKGFLRSLPDRMALLLLSRAFKRARLRYPAFYSIVEESLAELSLLERSNESSLDKTADKFSVILAAAASGCDIESRRRIMRQLLYHTGRYIYILDACDDLKEDAEKVEYNPVSTRFSLEGGTLTDEAREKLECTLTHSQNILSSSFELLPEGAWSELIRNIIYLGMPFIRAQVLSGKWKNTGKSPK